MKRVKISSGYNMMGDPMAVTCTAFHNQKITHKGNPY